MDPVATPSWRGAKFIWRAVLIFNLGLGAYLFTRPTSKKEKKSTLPITPLPVVAAAETPPIPPPEPQYYEPIPEPVKLPDPEPLTVEQQRSVFEWMLEEKRKVNPQNRHEKKRVNEDKAILKQFLRADTIPKI